MSEFVLPDRKNVVFNKVDQDAQSGSAGDFTFSSTPPQLWDDGEETVGQTLETILEDVDIRFEASSAGYTSGDYVNSWTNLGSATNRDLSNPTKAGLDITKPTFDIGGTDNPFVDGAMKFVLDADVGTNESDYLEFDSRLTNDGEIARFRKGIEKIIERNPVPVVPMAIKGMWGSFFSHKGGPALTGLPKRFWSKVELIAGEPVMPEDVTAARMQEKVEKLKGLKE